MAIKKVDFLSCDFDIFYDSIGRASKFHADEIYFFLSISFGNYTVEIIQMTLELAWIYGIHHFQ